MSAALSPQGLGVVSECLQNPLRLALRKAEAAAALGVSDESFDRYCRPHLRVVRLGTVRIYPVADLERFLAERAAAPVDELDARRAA